MGEYMCPNCKAARKNEERDTKTEPGVLRLDIVYECGSWITLRREGAVWKVINEQFKCKFGLDGRDINERTRRH